MYIDYPLKRQGQMVKILSPHILHKLSSTLTIRSQTHHENNCFSLPTYDFGSKPQCIILENLNGPHKSHLEQAILKTPGETQVEGLPWPLAPRPIP